MPSSVLTPAAGQPSQSPVPVRSAHEAIIAIAEDCTAPVDAVFHPRPGMLRGIRDGCLRLRIKEDRDEEACGDQEGCSCEADHPRAFQSRAHGDAGDRWKATGHGGFPSGRLLRLAALTCGS